MKKILLIIPLIFIMVFSIIPGMSASAKRVYNEDNDGYTEETVTSFAPAAVDFTGNYFWFHTSMIDWSQIVHNPQERATFYWAYLDLDNQAITTTEDNGVFHWTWSGTPFYGFSCTYSTYTGNTDRSSFNGNIDFVNRCKDLYYNTSPVEVL